MLEFFSIEAIQNAFRRLAYDPSIENTLWKSSSDLLHPLHQPKLTAFKPTKNREEKHQKPFKANEVLATHYSVDEYVKKGLIETITVEKKRRKRGKKLYILGKEDHSRSSLVLPTLVTLVYAREH